MTVASIVIPAYNCEKFLRKTLDSIFFQTFQDFEILIIDDGSTDGTKQIAESYSDERIRYFYQENHGGPSKGRNVGIDNARGDYIFIFDSDDIMRSSKLEFSIKAMEQHPNVDMIFTRFSLVDENDEVVRHDYLHEYVTLSELIGTNKANGEIYTFEIQELLKAVVKTNFVGTSSVVLRRAALALSDRFDEGLKNADDRLFWIQFLSSHRGAMLNEILHDYRIVTSGITSQGMLKKGPNKISALLKAKTHLPNHMLKKMVDREISNNYLAMARESKNVGVAKNQLMFALMSLRYKVNYKAFKLLVSALLPRFRKKYSR